jgi:Dehydrogenases with different specificities (related to short-chain alcohol dehydrogenases)
MKLDSPSGDCDWSRTIDRGELRGRTVALVGGGTGIGLQVARICVTLGAQVVLGGRTPAKLAGACEQLGSSATWKRVDTADHVSLSEFFDDIDVVDHLFTTAADYVSGSMRSLSNEQAESAMASKFWGQYYAVKYALPKFSSDGSVVLLAGADGARPTAEAAAYVACNAAVEGLGRGLAFELAPVRVNTISPGAIDGNFWSTRKKPAIRDEAFARYQNANLTKRVGTEAEVAAAVVFLFSNGYSTGSTMYLDGGYSLR